MAQVTEVAPDIYRISTYTPEINIQFNQFLVLDEEPLLFHTGLKILFTDVQDAVATLIDPSRIHLIGLEVK